MVQQSQGGFLIAKIHQISDRILSRLLRENSIEINPAQGRIMFSLWNNDNLPIRELAKRTSLSKSSLTSMLDRLEDAGYIYRVASSEDRREVLIRRTEKDKSFWNRYILVSRQMTRIFYEGFEDTEIEMFEQYLERILKNVERYDD